MTLLSKIGVLVAALTLSACGSVSPRPAGPEWSRAIIDIEWVEANRIDAVCRELAKNSVNAGRVGWTPPTPIDACAFITGGTLAHLSPPVCSIRAVKPASFRDQKNLALLGHEAYHCFGANHD